MLQTLSINIKTLENFIINVMTKLGVPKEDGAIVAKVLTASDRRGIASHGVARLHRYVTGLKNGTMKPTANTKIVKETANTARIDGGASLGHVIGTQAMNIAIKKAKENAISAVTVQNSNHYGIAGYYAMMALEENLIGISLTNSGSLVVPTFAQNCILGTNPISVAAPAKNERPYVLDMATSTVPSGKIEVYNRREKPLPLSWAIDEHGTPTDNSDHVLDNWKCSPKLGGLLPLGGATEEHGGHKGYGLGVLVDILCGVLSGGSFGLDVYGKKGQPADVCHFFAAINIEAFMPLNDFTQRMDSLILMLKNAPKIGGKDRIYIHGEKEWEMMDKFAQQIDIEMTVVNNLREIAQDVGVDCPF